MLKSIRVTNFKIVGDSGLLPLQPFTAFIGRNGSGKSSLLEALDWLSHAVVDGAEAATEPFQRAGDIINGWYTNSERTLGIGLVFDPQDASVGDEIAYQIEVGAETPSDLPRIISEHLSVKTRDGDTVLVRTSAGLREHRTNSRRDDRPIVKFTETPDYELQPDQARDQEGEFWQPINNQDRLALAYIDPNENRAASLLRDFLERAAFLRLNPRAIASFSPARLKRSPRVLDDDGARLAALLAELDDELIAILVEKLTFILQGASQLQSHKPSSPADRRYITLSERRPGDETPIEIPAWVISEGTRRMTAILATLLHPMPPPLLCVEEVENGLDPWTLKYLLEELSGGVDRGAQVLVTTHSPYLLDMLAPENIVLCDRKEYGVEFFAGERLPEADALQSVLGLGSLYTSRFLYPKD